MSEDIIQQKTLISEAVRIRFKRENETPEEKAEIAETDSI